MKDDKTSIEVETPTNEVPTRLVCIECGNQAKRKEEYCSLCDGEGGDKKDAIVETTTKVAKKPKKKSEKK